MKELKRGLQSMVGMGDRLGLVTYERTRQSIFLPESFTPGKTTVKEKSAKFFATLYLFR